MTRDPEIGVIIPVFEEQDSILEVLNNLETYLVSDARIYLIADHANDGTIKIAEDYSSESNLDIQILFQYPDSGPARAIKLGIKKSLEPFIVLMTADNSDDIRDILKLVQLLKSGYCVASASRYARNGKHIGGPFLKHLMSRTAGLFAMYILRSGTSDPTNLFKAVKREFVSTLQIESDSGFTIGLELVAKAQLYQKNGVSEIPTIWRERIKGNSNFKFLRWLPKYLYWYLILITYKLYSLLK